MTPLVVNAIRYDTRLQKMEPHRRNFGTSLGWHNSETFLAQEEHLNRWFRGQNSYGRNAYIKKIHGSTDINTEDTMGRIPMGETLAPEEKPWLSWHQHRRLHGQNSYGRDACTRRKTLALMTSTQETPRAEFLWAKRLHQENPRLHWHQHRRHYGQNSYGRDACTRRKTLALMTSTQKTPRAEFLWAKRLHQENPRLHWHQTQKTLWAEFLWARRLHKKKNPGSHDINSEDSTGRIPMGETLTSRKSTAPLTSNTKDTMGRIPMGETLAQEKKPWLSWHQLRRLHGQNSYGRNAYIKKIHGSTDIKHKRYYGQNSYGRDACTRRKTLALMTSTQKTPWAEFLWANAHMKKIHCCTDINTEVPWAKITMGETLAQEENPRLLWR